MASRISPGLLGLAGQGSLEGSLKGSFKGAFYGLYKEDHGIYQVRLYVR